MPPRHARRPACLPRRWTAGTTLCGLAIAAAALLASGGLEAQPSPRRVTNLAALLNYPAFFQMRPVVLVGTLALRDNGQLQLSDETGSVRVVYKGSAPDGLTEVRGEFWDVGRMNPDDPRLATLDLRGTFGLDAESAWPRPGQALAVVATAATPATAPGVPSVRGMVLFPARYREQKVTVVGQFAGRNILGDLPDAPGRSRYDFVLRTADAAIWVTGLRPRGKDFELSLDGRIDTGRWVEVTGTLQQGRGLQWLDAEGGTLKLAKAPTDQPEESPAVRVPAAPPPEVVFSAPTDGETDVATATTVRIQFSRDIDPATFKGRLKIAYAPAARGGPPVPITAFTTEYRGAARVLEVKFAAPLEALRTVTLTFDDGVIGLDKQPLKPWAVSFELGL